MGTSSLTTSVFFIESEAGSSAELGCVGLGLEEHSPQGKRESTQSGEGRAVFKGQLMLRGIAGC